MPLTPEDVQAKEFTATRLRPGYDRDEVDGFLDEVEAELARLRRDNADLRGRIAELEQQVGALRARGAPPSAPSPDSSDAPDATALRIITLAQQTADAAVADARREADELLARARQEAEQTLGQSRASAARLEQDAEERQRAVLGALATEQTEVQRRIDDLKAFEREYRRRLRAYLEAQLHELEGHSGAGPVGASAPSVRPGD